MKKKFKLVILLISLTSLAYLKFTSTPQMNKDEKLANQITLKAIEKISEEFSLKAVGTGFRIFDGIRLFAIGFESNRPLSVEEAREVMIGSIQTCLNQINENEAIRPYLVDYPFHSRNVEIKIWVKNSDQTEVPLGQINYITAIDGIISYYTRISDNSARAMLFKESYETALNEVEKERLI